MAQYFYDSQIKRFLIQFARIFSNWEVTAGYDPNNNPIIKRVPIMYGDSSRQANTILANNSASNLPSAPLITYWITGVEYDQRRTQDPYFVDKLNVRQRTFNTDTQEFETTQGNAFTVERLMPVPYTLRINVDFWTTNYNQKLELLEQLGTLFNPSMELQSTDNFIDWTSLSVVYQDGVTFSSRSVPQGTANPIDIMSWKFYMPIWISGAAKIQKMGVIQRIIASIFKGQYRDDMQDDDLLLGTRQKITPYGYKLLFVNNELQILPENQAFYPANSNLDQTQPPSTSIGWKAVLNAYGVVREGVSFVSLENPYMETPIVGTITYNPLDDRFLVYSVDEDTLPLNTLDPVDSVIDPLQKYPDNGLPGAIAGQRYLILNSIPQQLGYSLPSTQTSAWPGLTSGANENDIIEYNGASWTVSFDSENEQYTQYVTNLTSNLQYRFVYGEGWMKSFEGWYGQGNWSITI
jgi:hypothetical protein